MTTLSIPPKNLLILAGLGIAAYWFTSKKAGATTLPGNTNNSASKQFFVSPATASLRQAGQGTGAAQGNLISAALNALMNPAIVRTPGFNPTYTPDTAGESQAQAYYAANPDQFVSNPPTLYQQTAWSTAAAAEGNTGDY